jgi:hypothetical protein
VQKSGVTIYYPDKRPFIEKVEIIYEKYRSNPRLNSLIQRIREIE